MAASPVAGPSYEKRTSPCVPECHRSRLNRSDVDRERQKIRGYSWFRPSLSTTWHRPRFVCGHPKVVSLSSTSAVSAFGYHRNAIIESLRYIPLDRTTRLNAQVRCLLRHQHNAIVESLRCIPLDRTTRLNAQVRCLLQHQRTAIVESLRYIPFDRTTRLSAHVR